MIAKTKLFCLFLILKLIAGENVKYKGGKFPKKYLDAEDIVPTMADARYYINSVMRTMNHFHQTPNETDVNIAFGLYLMQSVLKRTIVDDANKIQEAERKTMDELVQKADYILSHYIYLQRPYSVHEDVEAKVANLLRDRTPAVYSISEFNRNRLKATIFNDNNLNDFAEQMDACTLPRENYIKMVHPASGYYVQINDSDSCISEAFFNPVPIDLSTVTQCTASPYCADLVYKSPSIAYALSHRLINVITPRLIRRCYLRTQEEDDQLMIYLCAWMYRETVYLARKGYFFRDLFMEHIAICSMLGYEEFFRRHWFRKIGSWIDHRGCMHDNHNFIINITRTKLDKATNKEEEESIRRQRDTWLYAPCATHQMVLSMVALSHAIRHAVHFSLF